jgi:hypothetical protein
VAIFDDDDKPPEPAAGTDLVSTVAVRHTAISNCPHSLAVFSLTPWVAPNVWQTKVSRNGLIMKALLTFFIVPLGVWFNVHAFMDISLYGRWDPDPFGGTMIHVRLAQLLLCTLFFQRYFGNTSD